MKVFLIILFFILSACGEDSEKEVVRVQDYAYSFCERHLGLRAYRIINGADLKVDCLDGSAALVKSYAVDGIL